MARLSCLGRMISEHHCMCTSVTTETAQCCGVSSYTCRLQLTTCLVYCVKPFDVMHTICNVCTFSYLFILAVVWVSAFVDFVDSEKFKFLWETGKCLPAWCLMVSVATSACLQKLCLRLLFSVRWCVHWSWVERYNMTCLSLFCFRAFHVRQSTEFSISWPGVLRAVYSDTTQLNSTRQHEQELTQFVGRDVINKNTTDLAVRCSTGPVELSSVQLSWVVSLQTPL